MLWKGFVQAEVHRSRCRAKSMTPKQLEYQFEDSRFGPSDQVICHCNSPQFPSVAWSCPFSFDAGMESELGKRIVSPPSDSKTATRKTKIWLATPELNILDPYSISEFVRDLLAAIFARTALKWNCCKEGTNEISIEVWISSPRSPAVAIVCTY